MKPVLPVYLRCVSLVSIRYIYSSLPAPCSLTCGAACWTEDCLLARPDLRSALAYTASAKIVPILGVRARCFASMGLLTLCDTDDLVAKSSWHVVNGSPKGIIDCCRVVSV